MFNYLIRRLASSLLTILVIATIIFLMIRVIPGDPARIFAGETATQEDVDRLRSQLGLDKPLIEQFGLYLVGLFQGDMGTSMRTHEPVLKEIWLRLPATSELAVLSIVFASLIGVPMGIISAVKRHSWFDNLVSVGALMGVAMPVYWLGLELIIIFAVKLKWLPAAGNQEGFKSAILPAFTLAAFSLALITRMTRAAMLEILNQDFVITARAKGLSERLVIGRHALRNALIPVVTVVGLQFGYLLGGSILTESIFAWPGMGRLLLDSLNSRDYPMVQGLVFVFASMFILVNLLVDLLYARIDPRIQYD
jgi:peptide/nickel transport system permease protein